MKYRFLLVLLAVVVLGIAVLLINQKRSYDRAVYRGRHVSEWAMDLHPILGARDTNAAMQAFLVLGANAVPALRAQLDSRTPYHEKLLLQNVRRFPRTIRRYLFDKIKPEQAIAQRVSAAWALRAIGPGAHAAVPDLIVALQDPAGEMRWAAAQALAHLGEPAIAALAAAATNANVTLRQIAVYALGEAGTNAAPAAGVLFDCVCDTNAAVQASALHALSRVGPAGVPIVLAGFSTDDPSRHAAAGQAIQAMSRPPRQLTRTLLEFATNAAPNVRRQSLEALQVLRLKYPYVVATYLRALEDRDPEVRCAAVRAMRQVAGWGTNTALAEFTARALRLNGTLDSNIVAKLTGLLTDSESSVRLSARRALEEIQVAPSN